MTVNVEIAFGDVGRPKLVGLAQQACVKITFSAHFANNLNPAVENAVKDVLGWSRIDLMRVLSLSYGGDADIDEPMGLLWDGSAPSASRFILTKSAIDGSAATAYVLGTQSLDGVTIYVECVKYDR